MIQLGFKHGLVGLARNQAHRVLGGAIRGGHRIAEWSEDERRGHCLGISRTFEPFLGDVRGKVGLEIGPGDNLGVCERLLDLGCSRMYAVEKFAHPTVVPANAVLIRQQVEEMELPQPVDFAIANDVFEHVDSVRESTRRVFEALRPGGVFVNSVDLRAHNMFARPGRPLDHLTAPDWLYSLLTSHIVTSNRVRRVDLVNAATECGFQIEEVWSLATADEGYVRSLRDHLQPRYRQFSDDELSVLQVLLVLRRPA